MPRPWAYFDTSVVVKRYVMEPGSTRARDLIRRHRFLSSVLLPVEAASALYRRRASEDLTERDLMAAIARMRQDRAHWELVEISPPVLERAEHLAGQASLSTLDAIHVASAMLLESMRGVRLPFVTADVRPREAGERLALDLVWVA
jgi:predicted nucleic acid-binding protein